MHWFLVIYMFSTNELLITEYNSKQECAIVQKKFKKAIMKENKDVKDVTCEQGEVMNSYIPEGDNESL